MTVYVFRSRQKPSVKTFCSMCGKGLSGIDDSSWKTRTYQVLFAVSLGVRCVCVTLHMDNNPQ